MLFRGTCSGLRSYVVGTPSPAGQRIIFQQQSYSMNSVTSVT